MAQHIVQEGDTLSHLAQRYLGDANRWEEIWAANRNEIGREQYRRDRTKLGPDWIYPGMKLKIIESSHAV